MIPEAHKKTAAQVYGYDITPAIERAYESHRRMALSLGWAMGYAVILRKDAVVGLRGNCMLILADDANPMNLWRSAWVHLHCQHIQMPWYRRWWIAVWEKVALALLTQWEKSR